MKMNKNDMQQALAYVVFMQTASYFDVKPECQSLILEQKLELYYKEAQMKKQFLMEQSCDNHLQKILKDIPEELWKMRSEVIFQPMDAKYGDGIFAVNFETWKYRLSVAGRFDRNGRMEFIHALHEFNIPARPRKTKAA